MGGEHERQRNEPSFSDERIDDLDSPSEAPVDLDQLLNEINNSITGTSASPARQRHGDGEAATGHSTPDDEPLMTPPPRQSALDFGHVEQSYAAIAAEPQPDFTNNNMSEDEPMSRGVLMAGGALVALSLLCGVVGLFVAFSASGKIESLQQSIDALQTKLATMQVSGDPRVGQLQAEQAGLASRIDELAMKMDSQAVTPAKGNDRQLADLRKRLDALEHKAAQPVKSATATSTSNAGSTKPAASSGDWTVILVSFPSSAQADSERARLQKLGVRAEVFKSVVEGKTWFRLRVPGYASQEVAKAAITALETKSGIDGAWVAHR